MLHSENRARSAETDYRRRRRSSAETEYHPRRRKKREMGHQRLSGDGKFGSSSSDDGRGDERWPKDGQVDEEKGQKGGNRIRAKSGISSYLHLRKSQYESETRNRQMSKGEKSKNMEAHIQQLQNIVENNRAEKSKMQDEKDQQTLLIDRLINTVDNLHKEMTEVADNRDALDSQVRNSLMKREDEADAEKKKLQNRCNNLEEKSVMLHSENRARSAETDYRRRRRSSAETEYHPRRRKKREMGHQRLSGDGKFGSSSSDDGRGDERWPKDGQVDEEKGQKGGNRIR